MKKLLIALLLIAGCAWAGGPSSLPNVPVPISQGGTGTTASSAALTALGGAGLTNSTQTITAGSVWAADIISSGSSALRSFVIQRAYKLPALATATLETIFPELGATHQGVLTLIGHTDALGMGVYNLRGVYDLVAMYTFSDTIFAVASTANKIWVPSVGTGKFAIQNNTGSDRTLLIKYEGYR